MKCCAAIGAKGCSVFQGSQNRRKYHEESTKVSMVSVSRRAGPPQMGQVVWRKPSWNDNGDCPVGRNSTSSGATMGSCSSGTGTTPWSGQYTAGMGQPQKR